MLRDTSLSFKLVFFDLTLFHFVSSLLNLFYKFLTPAFIRSLNILIFVGLFF